MRLIGTDQLPFKDDETDEKEPAYLLNAQQDFIIAREANDEISESNIIMQGRAGEALVLKLVSVGEDVEKFKVGDLVTCGAGLVTFTFNRKSYFSLKESHIIARVEPNPKAEKAK